MDPFEAEAVDEELHLLADSDEESDKLAPKPPSKTHDLSEMHHVQVTGTAYTTYAALLVWIHTRQVYFAPLLSSFRIA